MNPLELAVAALPGTVRDPLYPDSDGRPMGETDYHNIAMTLLREALQDFFRGREDVYVASNLLFYFEQGNPSGRRDPDVLVARGVKGNHFRRSYRLWEEGIVPCTLFEIASDQTWRTDLGEKRALYARIGVLEYFIFDAEGKYLEPRLQGFCLKNGQSVPISAASDGGLVSDQLGLRLIEEDHMLRLIDIGTGEPVLTRWERTEREQERAERERERAERERKQAERQRERAEREHERAEREHERAEAAERRADEMAAELATLRAQQRPPNGTM